MANNRRSFVMTGLITQATTLTQAGVYSIEGKLSMPTISEGSSADSQVVATINQNGSPVYVGQAGAEGFKAPLNVAANDVIAVVLSSSAAIDQDLNVIKCVVAIA